MNIKSSERSDRVLATAVIIPWFLIYILGALLGRSATEPYQLSVLILGLSTLIPISYILLTLLSRTVRINLLICILMLFMSAGTAYAVYIFYAASR